MLPSLDLLFSNRAADGGHLTTRHCALGGTAKITNIKTDLTTLWENHWNFFQVASLIYKNRLNHVRT